MNIFSNNLTHGSTGAPPLARRIAPLILVLSAILFGKVTVSSAQGHQDPPLPWWRIPSIHAAVTEEFFLRWMESQYGSGWLRWMPDPVIEMHWRRFLASWPHWY